MTLLPLRPNVCMFLLNSEGKIFLGQRHGEPGIWQLPQGGVEEGLSLEENVLKELSEELGAPKGCFQIVQKLSATHEYDFKTPPKYAEGKWRGQSQTFWVVRFVGEDSEICLSKYAQEFDDFKWVTPAELRRLAEPVRLPGYEAPLREVEALIAGLK